MSDGKLIRGGRGWGLVQNVTVGAIVDLSTVDISTEGTLDWWWMGNQSAASLPHDLTSFDVHRKVRGPGYLWRNFGWRYGGGSIGVLSQTSSRTLTASALDNINGIAINHTNRTGYFTNSTGMGDFGFTLQIPSSSRKRRLKMYSVTFLCDIEVTAQIWGIGSPASSTLLSSLGSYQVWTIDFASVEQSDLIVDARVINQTGTNGNFQIQGFTLAEVP